MSFLLAFPVACSSSGRRRSSQSFKIFSNQTLIHHLPHPLPEAAMVASFPEFDYKKHRSQHSFKAGCIPSSHHRPSRLNLLSNKTLRPSAANSRNGFPSDFTFLGRIWSFHGSFSHVCNSWVASEERPHRGMHRNAQDSPFQSSASKPKGKRKSSSDHSTISDAQNHVQKGNAGENKDLPRDNLCSHQPGLLHSGSVDAKLDTLNVNPGKQTRVESPKKNPDASNGDPSNSTENSASSRLVALIAREDDSRVCNCEVANSATSREIKCTHLNVYLDTAEDCAGAQNCGKGSDAARIALSRRNSDNVASSSSDCHDKANCENLRKASCAMQALHNVSNENLFYASDNSSNNMRWSSTSCASTDTSSSNSTRLSSCELRIPIVHSSGSLASQAKPHKAQDATWAAIRNLKLQNEGAPLSIGHFKLIRRVGHGDIGSVFLARLNEKYVASPFDASCLFAIKVMDKDALAHRNKLQRMHMEKEILESVDHPFLPTLYAHFNSEQFSCLVMDFCPGGDLYTMRQKQPGKRFSIAAARFYTAEVLLALEYLHMLGTVYRDLKPENVLVQQDGHIMLTDFDLSLKSDVEPQLLKHKLSSSLPMSSSSSSPSTRRLVRSRSLSSTISSSSSMSTSFLHGDLLSCRLPVACSMDPVVSCLSLPNKSKKDQQTHRKHLSAASMSTVIDLQSSQVNCRSEFLASTQKNKSVAKPPMAGKEVFLIAEPEAPMLTENLKEIESSRIAKLSTIHAEKPEKTANDTDDRMGRASNPDLKQHDDCAVIMELVAEPTQAKSMSFVGTHEYLAPEIIVGHGHGSPVDWWTLGIFLYELLFGRTPFKGASNDQTLINIIRQQLKFPRDIRDDQDFDDARNLIQGLLAKDPRRRMGCVKGAAEIKQHSFFNGVNWALIRCMKPPQTPFSYRRRQSSWSSLYQQNHRHNDWQTQSSKALHNFDLF